MFCIVTIVPSLDVSCCSYCENPLCHYCYAFPFVLLLLYPPFALHIIIIFVVLFALCVVAYVPFKFHTIVVVPSFHVLHRHFCLSCTCSFTMLMCLSFALCVVNGSKPFVFVTLNAPPFFSFCNLGFGAFFDDSTSLFVK